MESIILILIRIYFIVCWLINAVQFFRCDFASPYKDEVIHGIGLFTFYLSGITVYF